MPEEEVGDRTLGKIRKAAEMQLAVERLEVQMRELIEEVRGSRGEPGLAELVRSNAATMEGVLETVKKVPSLDAAATRRSAWGKILIPLSLALVLSAVGLGLRSWVAEAAAPKSDARLERIEAALEKMVEK